MRVVFAPEVEEDLYGLIKILVEKEYLGTYPFAISYEEFYKLKYCSTVVYMVPRA